MPIPFEPWISYPSLTPDRLKTVASIIRDTRNATVFLHEPLEGDTAWSLGCRVYSRTIAKIRSASLEMPWLRVLPESQNLKFTFSIGRLPIKFYKGDPEDIPDKCLVRSFSELAQMKLAFDLEGVDATNMLRLAVGVDMKGNTTFVTLVEVNELGTPLRIYDIPLDASNIIVFQTKPIDLEPPLLEVIDEESLEERKRAEPGDRFGTTDTES